MAGLVEVWTQGSETLGPLLANHLGQATLFAGVVLLLLYALRRGPARLRHALCLLASLKFLVPSALIVGLAARLQPETAVYAGALQRLLRRLVEVFLPGGAPAAGGSGFGPALLAGLSLIWLAGAALLFTRWAARHRAFAEAVRRGRRPIPGRETAAMERARRRLGLAERIDLVESGELAEPAVWGVRRPVVVLPEGVADHLTGDELETVLLHELVHVQRRDNLLATLHRGLCCLFWFHPLVWLLDRRLLVERERLCDDRVVALCGRSEVYARGLLKVLRAGLTWRLAGVSAATASNLGERMERLRRPPEARWPRLAQRAGIVFGAAFFLAFSLLAAAPAVPCPEDAEPRTLRVLVVEAQERFCPKPAPLRPAAPCPEAG